ncbi:MAG: hypothetical protein HKP61_17915 [Dactylosporangium sp.]|nr:hypothetical protein [Dactylosporangium sp.]NNJ62774.1 hypothetical protein [Dactylosporangium sp.]
MPAAQVPQTTAVPVPPDPPAGGQRRPELARRLALGGAGLLAAWALPLLAHVTGLDLVLPPLVLLAAAALVRGGRTLIDQVVVAAAGLFGVLCLAGLPITWWSLGLHPVPLAGVALSALVVVAALARRRPVLRWRLRAPDGVVLGAMALVSGLVLRQFVQRDDVGRLALLAPGEDLARHFILYDAIERLNGYAFLRPEAVADLTAADHANYPQGLHFLVAVLGRFWRSSGTAISGPVAMDWLVWCHVATYIGFAVGVLWAVRRMAGPALSGAGALIAGGVATAYLFFGDPLTIFLRAFPNELAGLGLVAVLVALCARPLSDPREQLLALAALTVGIGFTYYLFMPVVVVAALGWLLARRRQVLRRPVLLGAAVVWALPAAIPALHNPMANRGAQLLLPGTAIPVDPEVLLAVFLVIAAALATGSGLRSPAWRLWAAAATASIMLAGGIAAYQYLETGRRTSYYGEKGYHLVMVLAIVGLAAVARLLPEPPTGPGRFRVRALLPAGALALAAFTLFGAVNGPPSSSAGGSYGTGLVRGREGVRRDGPAVAYDASRRYPQGAGRVTVDLSHGGWADFYGTLYGLAMQRTYVVGVGWYAFLYPDGDPRTLADLERQVLETALPIRFLVSDPEAAFLTADPGAAHPGRDAGTAADTPGGEAAMTNMEAARYLAEKYPDRVEVVSLGD